MRRLFGIIALFLLSVPLFAQSNQTITAMRHRASGGTGTFSFVQLGDCTITSGSNTCTATMSQALTSGNAYWFSCAAYGNETNPAIAISSVTASGTLIPGIASSIGGYGTPTETQGYNAVILPSTSGGGSSTEVITVNQNTNGGNCIIAELHPSANGSNVGIANDTSYQPGAACTSCVNQTITPLGTNPAILQMAFGSSAYETPTAVSPSGCTTNDYVPGSGAGAWSLAVTASNCNPPTWTTSSVVPIMQTITLAWNPPAYSPMLFQGAEGGTNGSAPTVATLIAGNQGALPCQWSVSNVVNMVFSTSASVPLAAGTGNLGDGSSVSSGAGSLGFSIPNGESSATTDYIQCSWKYNNPFPNAMFGFKYNDSMSASSAVSIDCGALHGLFTYYVGANCYGSGATRTWNIETPNTIGSKYSFTGGTLASDCGSSAGQACTIILQYQSNADAITATSVSTSIAGSTVTWSGTFTASQWPMNFAFSPSSCTGGSNYNGQLFTVVSASATQITSTTTGYTNGGGTTTASGSATGCTLNGQESGWLYNSSGSLLAVSFDHDSGIDLPSFFEVGQYAAVQLPTSTHFYWDSLEVCFSLSCQMDK